jgi:hypothetical protein
MHRLLEDAADAPVQKRIDRLKELQPRIPLKDGKVISAFTDEVFGLIPPQLLEVFDSLAVELAKAGHLDDALEFAQWEEFLLPTRQGVATALVNAASGKQDEALAALKQVAADAAREAESRVMAIDGLLQLDDHQTAASVLPSMLEQAEAGKDLHLTMAIAERLSHALEVGGDRAGAQKARDRLEALAEEHHRLHPHHH